MYGDGGTDCLMHSHLASFLARHVLGSPSSTLSGRMPFVSTPSSQLLLWLSPRLEKTKLTLVSISSMFEHGWLSCLPLRDSGTEAMSLERVVIRMINWNLERTIRRKVCRASERSLRATRLYRARVYRSSAAKASLLGPN